MAFSQQDLDAIEMAIASGELTVKVNGREITYRSMDQLLKARGVIRDALAAALQPAAPTFGGVGYSLANFSRE